MAYFEKNIPEIIKDFHNRFSPYKLPYKPELQG